MDNLKLGKKIIGYEYVSWHSQVFAVDVYEGNYFYYPDGNVDDIKDPKRYERILSQYQEKVEKGEKIFTAYEQNKRMDFDFKIPALSADPEAAEKEWFLRTHPGAVPVMEEPRTVQRKGFFGKIKKKAGVRCAACGAACKTGQKFCAQCGAILQDVDENPGHTMREVQMEEAGMSAREESVRGSVPLGRQSPLSDPAPVPAQAQDMSARKDRLQNGSGKRAGKTPLLLLFAGIIFVAGITMSGVSLLLLNQSGEEVRGGTKKAPSSAFTEEEPVNEAFVGIRIKRQIMADQQDTIREEDLEGTILTPEQYQTLTERSAYIDSSGQLISQTLLSWEDREQVIGQYVTATLPKGSLLYDTSVTTQHIITDRTYVQAEADGEEVSLEIEGGALPGSTQIQIVALVSTDGQNPVRVLLSEMTLQDRSLESIFNAAGEDILKMLAGEGDMDSNMEQEEKDPDEEESSSEESSE